LAVKCSAETFLVYGSLVLRNYIRGDSRQLLVAANRCSAILNPLQNNENSYFDLVQNDIKS